MLENAGRRLGRLLVQGLDDVGGALIREPGRERGRSEGRLVRGGENGGVHGSPL